MITKQCVGESPCFPSPSQKGDSDRITIIRNSPCHWAGPVGRGKSGGAGFILRSLTAASWQICGFSGQWIPPRAARKGVVSRWPPGRNPDDVVRKPDLDEALTSLAPRSLRSTGVLCRFDVDTASWGPRPGNAQGKPDSRMQEVRNICTNLRHNVTILLTCIILSFSWS